MVDPKGLFSAESANGPITGLGACPSIILNIFTTVFMLILVSAIGYVE